MNEALSSVLELGKPEQLAIGFGFTEGPTWHPEGRYYFVDIRANRLYRLTPGNTAEVAREDTREGNGTTFDIEGRLLLCVGGNRRVTRTDADGRIRRTRVGKRQT
jgi:gluconolactonase